MGWLGRLFGDSEDNKPNKSKRYGDKNLDKVADIVDGANADSRTLSDAEKADIKDTIDAYIASL